MSEVSVAVRAKLIDDGKAASNLSETFLLLQAGSEQNQSEAARLERLINLLQDYERKYNARQIQSREDDGQDDEDREVEPSVLIEATTMVNGEQQLQHLFEDLNLFRGSLNRDRLALLRATRQHGQLKPEALARLLARDLGGVHADIRQLAQLGLIEENRRGVRVDYDELILSIRVND
jgi:predicted transcriptional regulator